MSEFENKYAEVLSHFTEPDVPLKPDALMEDDEALEKAEDTPVTATEETAQPEQDNPDEAPAKDAESSNEAEEKITYTPLSEETQSNITTPLKKKIPWKTIAASVMAVLLIAGIIFSLPKGGGTDEVKLFTDSMLSFAKKDTDTLMNLYGVVNKRGKTVAEPEYSMTFLPGENVILASEGSDSVAFYTGSGAKLALVSKKGKQITEFVMDDTAGRFSQKLMAASKDDKWGYIDKKGKWKIKNKYADAHNFAEGLAGVRNSKTLMWGFVNKKGKKIIDFKFEEVGQFKDKIAPVKLDGKWGFADRKGNLVIDNKFADVGTFENGRAIAVNSKGKWGYINEKGKWVIKASFDEIREFSENLSAAKKDGKWGYIDNKGNWVIENKYYHAGDFSNGLACVSKSENGRFIYIDKNGKKAIESAFDAAYGFVDRIALVKTKKGFEYINTRGEKVINDTFSAATDFFDDGYAVVCKEDPDSPSGEKWYVINRKGKKIFKRTFESM